LLDFLKRQFPGEKNLQIASVKPLTGGFSKQTLFVNLAGNAELPERLVMRRDPPYVTQGTSVSMEFPILQQVHAAGIRVPKPWAVEPTGDLLGTPFMLLAFAPGGVIGDFLVVHQPSRGVALNMARLIAQLHQVPIAKLEGLLPGGGKSVRERMRGELEGLDAMWKKVRYQKAYAVQAALDWLQSNLDLADGPRKLAHRDVGVHNLLVNDGEISAVLDWETVVIGTPAEDIAYAHYQIVQMMDWDEFVAEYEKAAGVRLDRRQLDYYMLYASIRIAVGASSMVDPVFSGDRSSLLHFFIGDYFVQTLLNRVSAKLAEVLSH
jgi:aminoglycoside phosphotransferase (APT) family kinase protein